MLCSCGVGSYSVTSGKADEGMVSFVSESKTPITVTVDDSSYDIYTVKTKAWRKDRDIRKTVQNTIVMAPGTHEITVKLDGKEVYAKKVFISAQEHKIIEL